MIAATARVTRGSKLTGVEVLLSVTVGGAAPLTRLPTSLLIWGERLECAMTLDRKHVNESYHKDNCRWATKSEQRKNQRRKNVMPVPKEQDIPF